MKWTLEEVMVPVTSAASRGTGCGRPNCRRAASHGRAVALARGTPLFTAAVDGPRLSDARRFDGSDNVLLSYAGR